MTSTKNKNNLRIEIKNLFKTYTEKELAAKSNLALHSLELESSFINANTILLYWSLPDEVHTHVFIQKWSKQKNILLPTIVGNKIEARTYTNTHALREGKYSLQEPTGSHYEGIIDLVIVPGRAFDLEGHRLGRGKGFYDVFLENYTGVKIGLCFDFQLKETIPFEPFDCVMHKVICD